MGRKAKVPYFQINLNDRFLALSKRGQDAIRKSRLGHFGDEIFPRINPDDFMVLYSENGRGPSFLQGYVGAYLIMCMLNLTVDELLLRIDSDIAIQYALQTTSLPEQPFSRRNSKLIKRNPALISLRNVSKRSLLNSSTTWALINQVVLDGLKSAWTV